MTQVWAEITENSGLLRADGHATGSPEVCAAVSGILYALAGYLVNAEAKGLAKATARRMESGHVCLRYEGQVREVYEMAVIGLLQLEKSYPELVKVTLPPG